jgi:hypothetical protein
MLQAFRSGKSDDLNGRRPAHLSDLPFKAADRGDQLGIGPEFKTAITEFDAANALSPRGAQTVKLCLKVGQVSHDQEPLFLYQLRQSMKAAP